MTQLTDTALMTMVTWQARNAPDDTPYQGCYRIVTKDVGATIGVGVYTGKTLIHSFYAHTSHTSYAREITQQLIGETVKAIQQAHGAEYVAAFFPYEFPTVTRNNNHRDLPAEDLT